MGAASLTGVLAAPASAGTASVDCQVAGAGSASMIVGQTLDITFGNCVMVQLSSGAPSGLVNGAGSLDISVPPDGITWESPLTSALQYTPSAAGVAVITVKDVSTTVATTLTVTVSASAPADPPPPTYTVSLNGNGGSCTAASMTSVGATWVAIPGTCTRSGYTFAGWSTSAAGTGTMFTQNQQLHLTGDNTIYAQWTALPPSSPQDFRATGRADEAAVETSLDATWRSPGPSTSHELDYCLMEGGTCGAWTRVTVPAGTSTARAVVPKPGAYSVRLRAVDSIGQTSPWVTTSVTVPTGAVNAPTGVNAWGSADDFLVLWTSSGLPSKWLRGYRVQMQLNDPNGVVGQWQDVKTTTGSGTVTRLTAKQLGTKAGSIVRFRVFTVPVFGTDSRASSPSPRRQQTDDVPTPLDFAATYDAATDLLTMTWKNAPITTSGGANVGGYEFAYMWPGSSSWITLGSPLSYDSERAVFSLENVPRGTFKVRIRSIGWPDDLYSEWTSVRSVRK